ncbi:FHA domain-containing protein [Salana multivorans]|uniref:FHA domain-containing protein n=1 Tax=Salana multivorans TaxID=120377 RepID=A0A3N2D8V1_9MICO|nr:RDD family protein [Salana multivorans]ROR96058.1 FHA domain-containing protein [Salana multivorans]
MDAPAGVRVRSGRRAAGARPTAHRLLLEDGDGATFAASAGRRLGGYAVDGVAVLAPSLAALLLLRSPALALTVGVELVLVLALWEARTGRTLGKLLLGLRAARVDAPVAPGLGRSLARAVLVVGAQLTAVTVPLLWFLGVDRRGQAGHDRIAGTRVATRRPPRPPRPRGDAAAPGAAAAGAGTVGAAAVGAGASVATGHPGGVRLGSGDSPEATTAQIPVVASVTLVLPDGQRLTLVRDAVVGRAPEPLQRGQEALVLADATNSVSRSHALLRLRGGQLWVEDLGSANGTTLVRPDGHVHWVERGESSRVEPGMRIGLGQMIVTVEL